MSGTLAHMQLLLHRRPRSIRGNNRTLQNLEPKLIDLIEIGGINQPLQLTITLNLQAFVFWIFRSFVDLELFWSHLNCIEAFRGLVWPRCRIQCFWWFCHFWNVLLGLAEVVCFEVFHLGVFAFLAVFAGICWLGWYLGGYGVLRDFWIFDVLFWEILSCCDRKIFGFLLNFKKILVCICGWDLWLSICYRELCCSLGAHSWSFSSMGPRQRRNSSALAVSISSGTVEVLSLDWPLFIKARGSTARREPLSSSGSRELWLLFLEHLIHTFHLNELQPFA